MCVVEYTRLSRFAAVGAVSMDILLDSEKGSPALHIAN